MWGKPNSCLLLAVRQVEKPHWKPNHYSKNSTLKHTASNVAPNDKSESSIGQPHLSLSSCKIHTSQPLSPHPEQHAVHWMKVLSDWDAQLKAAVQCSAQWRINNKPNQCQILFQSLDPLSNHIQHAPTITVTQKYVFYWSSVLFIVTRMTDLLILVEVQNHTVPSW